MGVFWVIPLKRALAVMMSGCQLQGLVDLSPVYNHTFSLSYTYLQFIQQHKCILFLTDDIGRGTIKIKAIKIVVIFCLCYM